MGQKLINRGRKYQRGICWKQKLMEIQNLIISSRKLTTMSSTFIRVMNGFIRVIIASSIVEIRRRKVALTSPGCA